MIHNHYQRKIIVWRAGMSCKTKPILTWWGAINLQSRHVGQLANATTIYPGNGEVRIWCGKVEWSCGVGFTWHWAQRFWTSSPNFSGPHSMVTGYSWCGNGRLSMTSTTVLESTNTDSSAGFAVDSISVGLRNRTGVLWKQKVIQWKGGGSKRMVKKTCFVWATEKLHFYGIST